MMRVFLIIGLVLLAACNKNPAAPGPTLTRAQLANFDQPILLGKLERYGTSAGFAVIATNGDVATWHTLESVALSLRNGVLVGTRGMGEDLISAEVDGSLAALAGRRSGYYPKFHSYLDGENQTFFRSLQCTITDRASETIVIVERSHATTRFEETCHSPGLKVVNHFWHGDGIMWKSRQWISPTVGYLTTERLVR